MTPQDKSQRRGSFSAVGGRALGRAYRALERVVGRHPWLVQGSVNVVAPTSPAGRVTYTWTRKVKAKTVTVALSRQQAAVFRQAIAANRVIEAALRQIRDVSQHALLRGWPGVTKRRGKPAANGDRRLSQRGLK